MVQKQKAMQQYNQVSVHAAVEGASPYQLVQILYSELLKKISESKGNMERGNLAIKGKRLSTALAIVTGLRASLDHRSGGEIAATLDRIYEYISNRLVTAIITNDSEILDEVSELITIIKDGWDSMPEDTRHMTRTQMIDEISS